MARAIQLPGDLLEEINAAAQQQGRTVEQVVTDAVRKYLADVQWQAVLAYGAEQAKRLGYTESDVERLIQETR